MKNSTKFSFYFCLQIQFRLQQGFSNDKKVCDMLNFGKENHQTMGIYILFKVSIIIKEMKIAREPEENVCR